MGILDILFPKFCVNCRKLGSYICTTCFSYISFIESGVCMQCKKNSLDFLTHPLCRRKYGIDGVFSSVSYKGPVKKLLYQFKYKPFVTDLKKTIHELLVEGLIQKESFYFVLQKKPLLIPIPLFESRMKKRGYNQAELLAKSLAKQWNLSMLQVLTRVKNTTTQVQLNEIERRDNIKNAFVVKEDMKQKIKNASVCLIDDVVTTGATLKEAAKVLKHTGAKNVWAITFAQD